MRRPILTAILALLLLAITLSDPNAPSAAAQTDVYLPHVPAAAEWAASTCPPDPSSADKLCEQWYILYFLEGEAQDLRAQPWRLFVYHDATIYHSADDTVTVLFENTGLIENPQGTFDLKRYTYASVSGAVPMSDGSTVEVNLVWDMASAELHHGGNESAFNPSNGIDRHYNDRCITLIQLAHQQWRWGPPGQAIVSISGIDVESLFLNPNEPFIAGRSHYTYVTAQHRGCALG